MTLANKITISRFFFIPLMIAFAILGMDNMPLGKHIFFNITIGQIIFIIFFALGSFTDFLDGYFARKKNEVTTFGKFLDPILDKLLVVSAFLLLILFPNYKSDIIMIMQILIAVIIILIREFLITGFRLVSMEEDVVIAASFLGKIKTAFTMVTIIIMAFNGFGIKMVVVFDYLSITSLWITVLLTVLSGVDYIYKNREMIKKSVRKKDEEN